MSLINFKKFNPQISFSLLSLFSFKKQFFDDEFKVSYFTVNDY